MRKFITVLAALAMSVVLSFAQNDVIRILAIGNSFSEDAVEEHLHSLAKEEGVTLIIGNMYIGGCSIERHVNNLRADKPEYKYRKITAEGVKSETPDFSLSKALADEQWDYVSVQQASPYSGLADSYGLLPELVDYVKARVPEDAVIMFHQTWAYAKNSNHQSFPNYGRDQMKMYNAILSVTEMISEAMNDIKIIIPSGTAIQNARTSLLGDDMTRDGYHLSRPQGRYTAACTWLEAVLGINPVGNTYCPEGMTAEQCKAAQKSAHKAVKNPKKISVIK
jgi:hypothetical protein